MESITKTCSRCKQEKSVSDFCNNRSYPDGKHVWCRECHAKSFKDWRRENAERTIENKKEWAAKNKEHIKKYEKEYREKNKEKRKEARRKYYLKNRDLEASRSSVYKKEHRKEINKSEKLWRDKNKDRGKVYHENRRARKKNGNGMTPSEWNAILETYGNKCLACGSKENISIDHVVPLSLGGLHEADNIQPLCRRCNSKKHTRIIDYR